MMSLSDDNEVMIAIPRAMYERIRRKILGTNYGSVQDYVKAVLDQLMGSEMIDGADNKPGLSPEDEERVKEKLKALGYL
jgi:hypothetical protein